MAHSRIRRILRGVGWGLLSVPALLLLVLLSVQVDPVGRAVLNGVVGAVLPEGMRMEAEEVSGSWIRGLTLAGIRLENPERGMDVMLDTLRISFNPLTWRWGRVGLARVEAAGLAVRYDLSAPDTAAVAPEEPAGDGGWSIEADSVVLRRGRATLEQAEGESWGVTSVGAHLADVRMGPGVRVGEWSVQGSFSPAGTAPEWGQLQAAGSLDPGALVLDTIALNSPRSRLAGSGRVALDRSPTLPGAVRWQLEAAPLALADLQGLTTVPGVLEGDSLFITTWAREEGDSARVHLAVRTSPGATLDGDLLWRREGERWGGGFQLAFRGLNPRRYLGEGAPAGPAEGGMEGRVEGLVEEGRPSRLDGDGTLTLSTRDGALAAGFRVTRRTTPEAGAVDALALRLDTLAWDPVHLAGGEVAVERSGGITAWEMTLSSADGGAIRGSGSLDESGGDGLLRYAATVVLDSVTDPFSGSRVTGSASLDGEGLDPFAAQASLGVVLGPSSIGGWPLDTASVSLDWRGGQGDLTGRFASPRGRAALEAALDITRERGSVRVTRLALDSLVVLPDTTGTPFLILTGGITGEAGWEGTPGAAADPTNLSGQVTYLASGTRVGSLQLDSARMDATWEGGVIETDARVVLPDSGVVELHGSGTVLDSLTFILDRGEFRQLELRHFLPSAPSTSLSGTLAGEYRAARGNSPAWTTARLELDPSRVAQDTIQALQGELVLAGDTLQGDMTGELAAGDLQARFSGLRSPEGMAWDADFQADLPRLGRFFGRADTAVSLLARGEGQGGGAAGESDLSLEVLAARGWGVRMDSLVVHGRLEPGTLVLDTVLIRSNVLEAHGAGGLPLELVRGGGLDRIFAGDTSGLRFHLAGHIPDSAAALDLGPRGTLMARDGSLSLETLCQGDSCAVDGSLELGALVWGNYSVASTMLEVEGRILQGPEIRETRARLALEGIQTPSARIRSVEVDATMEDELLDLTASTLIDDRRDAEISLEVDPRLGRERMVLRDLHFRMDEDEWNLRQPATVIWGGEGIALDTLEVSANGQRILAFGELGGPEGHDFTVRLDSVRVGTISDLAGAPGLDGWVDATVDGYGTDPSPFLEILATGEFAMDDRPLHRFRIQGDRNRGFLALDASLLDTEGTRRLRLSGEIPLEEEGGPDQWALDLTADSVPLEWAEPYLSNDVARGLRGSADAELAIRGPRQSPTFSGPVGVDGGRVTLPVAGITLSEMRIRATATDRTLTLDTVRVRSEGTASLEGTLAFPSLSDPVELDLELSADDFLGIDTRAYHAIIGGSVAITGTSRLPELQGSVRVAEADIRLDEGLGGGNVEDVTLTDQDWATLQTRFGLPRPRDQDPSAFVPQGAALDLSIALGRDIWLRQEVNPEMAVQFTGDFTLAKSAEAQDFQLQGQVEAIPQRSYLEQFGRRFQLEEGTVHLRGPIEDTQIRLVSVYEIVPRDGGGSEVNIRLTVEGRPRDLSLTLSSTPAMENSDIVSYLATGRPASSAFSGDGEGTSATGLGTDLVASQLTGLLEQFAMRDMGLDVVEIRREGLRDAILVAGQYVTPELFLGFRQPLSFGGSDDSDTSPGQTQAEVEYRAFRWLLLHLETGGQAFRFFLQGSIGY